MELTDTLSLDGSAPGCPLPRRCVLGGPIIKGTIKVRAEDFIVEELPLYDPIGKGEHLYLGIRKIAMPHTELVRILRQHFRVNENAIGYAGMKDKVAVTTQQFSIHLPDGEPSTLDIRDKRIDVLWARRHVNKLRRGHLLGNRFSIRVRETDPLKAPVVLSQMRKLESIGVPNYYGYQRFGYRKNTHLLGYHALKSDWTKVLDELLGATGSEFPDRQRKARELYDAGDYAGSLPLWSRNEHAESASLRALMKGASPEEAVKRINRYTVNFWISAYQSTIFNRVIDDRIDAQSMDRVDVGDVAMRDESRRQFVVHKEIHEDPTLADSVRDLEVSSTGPIWGKHMLEPLGPVREAELAALEAVGGTVDLVENTTLVPRGTRRPLRIRVGHVEVDSGVDEHGGYIRTAFDLPRGSYATVLLRELVEGIDPE